MRQWDHLNQNQLQIIAKPNQTILIMMKTMEENMKLLRNLLVKPDGLKSIVFNYSDIVLTEAMHDLLNLGQIFVNSSN